MTEDIKNKLLMCAEMYHRADFIQSDPVQFPHRYTLKQDIEVSGLLTAIMSFGNRKQILKKAEELHGLMGDSPYQYVLSRQWEGDFPPGATVVFIGCCHMLISMDISSDYTLLIHSLKVWKKP